MKNKLFFLSAIVIGVFTYFSYTVAKERWTQLDFDTTVKLQDHIPRKFDLSFSYFSLLGSAEFTIGLCLVLAFLSLIKKRFLASLGWLMIVPTSMGEVFGKLILYHPAPQVFLHRTLLPATLPSFYVHTDFSYPSGHMARTIFIITVFLCLVVFSSKNYSLKFIFISLLVLLAFLMGLTRVYLGEHWLSDVLGGSLLGLGVGLLACVFILRLSKD